MARHIPEHPKKGSPEAYAWAARMAEIRKKSVRQRVRRMGRKTEKQFFRKGKLKPYGGMELLGVNPRSRKRKPEWFYSQANQHWMLHVGGVGGGYYFIHHKDGKFILTFLLGEHVQYRREYPTLDAAMKAVDYTQGEKFTKPRKKVEENPIAVYALGNPKGKVTANIEGVIYNRVIEIRAEKTGYRPGFYKHAFGARSKVCLLALDNGDILVHSKAGIRLWGAD